MIRVEYVEYRERIVRAPSLITIDRFSSNTIDRAYNQFSV